VQKSERARGGEEGGINLQEQANTGLGEQVLGEQENGAVCGPAGDRHLKRPIEYHPAFVQVEMASLAALSCARQS
jgi:hypothetical protein